MKYPGKVSIAGFAQPYEDFTRLPIDVVSHPIKSVSQGLTIELDFPY
jgi:hypothetical protein